MRVNSGTVPRLNGQAMNRGCSRNIQSHRCVLGNCLFRLIIQIIFASYCQKDRLLASRACWRLQEAGSLNHCHSARYERQLWHGRYPQGLAYTLRSLSAGTQRLLSPILNLSRILRHKQWHWCPSHLLLVGQLAMSCISAAPSPAEPAALWVTMLIT